MNPHIRPCWSMWCVGMGVMHDPAVPLMILSHVLLSSAFKSCNAADKSSVDASGGKAIILGKSPSFGIEPCIPDIPSGLTPFLFIFKNIQLNHAIRSTHLNYPTLSSSIWGATNIQFLKKCVWCMSWALDTSRLTPLGYSGYDVIAHTPSSNDIGHMVV